MWTCDTEGVFKSELLSQFPWLRHGFGSQSSGNWPGEYTGLRQIHSDIVQIVDRDGSGGDGDALVSSTPGVLVGVRTADCVPILLADPERRVVAAVHAGWRGTVARIVQRTVEQMQQSFGSQPERIHAAIGPCIAECCFEVGKEVAAEFSAWFPDAATRTQIDLVAVNTAQLEEVGLPTRHLEAAGMCTVCNPAQFHSFRRDRERSGRMVSAIGILGG